MEGSSCKTANPTMWVFTRATATRRWPEASALSTARQAFGCHGFFTQFAGPADMTQFQTPTTHSRDLYIEIAATEMSIVSQS